MKCSNCDRTAMFEYRITLDKSIFYCESDLPSFLEARKRAGNLAITEEYKEATQTALDAITVKPSPVETPAPVKKKTAKKTAK